MVGKANTVARLGLIGSRRWTGDMGPVDPALAY